MVQAVYTSTDETQDLQNRNSMESITLELRPRLRSLNAYISLKSDSDSDSIRVKLLESSIQIRVDEVVFELPLSPINILPSSLSSLRISNRWISFRIQTKPNAMRGTFATEILGTDDELLPKISKHVERLPPKNSKCVVLCACCENEITRATSYDRILPLPNEDTDPGEWFCCKHSETNFAKSLQPKETDYFYGLHHFILHKSTFTSTLKIKNRNIHCDRCLTVIGTKNEQTLKIWNCCVKYKIIDEKKILHSPDPLVDFLLSIRDSAQAFIGELMLLEALDDNSSQYILLRPMELKLNLLIKENSKDDCLIDFQKACVTKVLYKYGNGSSSVKLEFPEAKYSEMAKSSILAGMEYLLASTKRFPPVYRRADDFYIGYVETERKSVHSDVK